MTAPAAAVTEQLIAWSQGDQAALEQLIPLVHDELHRLAKRYMRRERGQRAARTLQTTALVNEAYLRLIDARRVQWQNRAHFFAIAARLMRQILVDYARAQHYAKRGGGQPLLALDEALTFTLERAPDLVALDDALHALAALDERKGRVIELRFFGGLSVEETAEVLQVSPDTVLRDWRLAKAWLLRELSEEEGDAA
ncbi:MAG: sigma-70 family RNA polymerase sigma factor [Acidobacteria bacterium]|nr:sigma-70 family RNA polymerase sigma factor [Acidobacteriota bacterium]MBI3421651.1 sigma-70 family RNA polymerase sigma factor [Acidobacteriota bacterium]